MATSFQKPVNVFLSWIEKDIDFFRYFGLTDDEAKELAVKRSKAILLQANAALKLRCKCSVDFADCNTDTDEYNFELNDAEVYLIGSIMYELYLFKDFARLKLENVNYTATELRVFDPSNARSTFMEIYKNIVENNKLLIGEYRDTDRETGQYLTINYSKYDEE